MYEHYTLYVYGCNFKLISTPSQMEDHVFGKPEVEKAETRLAWLADIDPTTVIASKPWDKVADDHDPDDQQVSICFSTTNSENKIITTYENSQMEYKNHDFCLVGATSGITVRTEYAPRFVKALKHLIDLCGGKPSTF